MVSYKYRPVAERANSTKDGLEPFRWIDASRCATRGLYKYKRGRRSTHRARLPEAVESLYNKEESWVERPPEKVVESSREEGHEKGA
jgi:hypothetical protein